MALRILLGDLAYENAGNRHNLYVPLNVGYLASTVKTRFGREVDVQIFKCPHRLLAAARERRPNLVGLASYYWNDRLNDAVGRRLLDMHVTTVLGGPSIDSDREALEAYGRARPWASWFVTNEGEDAFAAIVGTYLSLSLMMPPGVMARGSYVCDPDALDVAAEFVHGKPGGLSTDLDKVPSPYLDGTLDAFIEPGLPYQPMIQTSRLCPFSCSFCVSGKNRGKLRAFPLDQVRAEVEYIASRFADRPDHVLYVVDENFGILERDLEVAEMINRARADARYPRRIFYYNDKRFTGISQRLHEAVGDMCHHGVTLSLQSENPETLKAIKRRNLPDERIAEIIAWARGRGLKTSTELIFGLPLETRESFLALLDKCARLGFDAIQCYNLIVFDGIEMNRKAYREEHGLRTRRRLIADALTIMADDDEVIIESEEVVTSTASFSGLDYRLVRKLNVMFHAIFVLGFEREFVRAIVADGWSLTAVLRRFLARASAASERWSVDLDMAIGAELYDDWEIGGLKRRLTVQVRAADQQAGPLCLPIVKLQPVFAGRLVKQHWAPGALRAAFEGLKLEPQVA